MMAAAKRPETVRAGLLQRLPLVRGRMEANVALAPQAWFRTGGPAEVLFHPADLDDLAGFLKNRPTEVPVTVLGAMSNSLIRDGGIRGVVIRLGKAFGQIAVQGAEMTAGAGAMDVNVAFAARDAGIAGLEFLRGIPGSLGGSLRMNAGAYGREMAQVVVAAQAVDPSGGVHRLDAGALGFSYRRCRVPEGWIFTQATLKGEAGAPSEIAKRLSEITQAREDTQPVKSRTGGSTFANPAATSAWKLIEQARCRGLRIGAAQVSEQHCNFLINTGGASAADLEALGEEVRRRVALATGVELEWEIRRLGEPSAPDLSARSPVSRPGADGGQP
jgi:UDP-N-acetylmuramate dehydrogenase